jgi:hypothetical protein
MPPFFLSIPGIAAVGFLVALVVHRLVTSRAAGGVPGASAKRLKWQIVLSLIVASTAMYVVIARPEATDDHKWAYSIVGVVVGYWLRGWRT